MKTCPVCKKKSSRLFTKKDSYIYFMCKNCVTLFLSPMPPHSLLSSLYDKKYIYQVDATSRKRMLSNSHRIVKELRKLYPAGKTLLDIGAGYGSFVKVASGVGLKAVGIEPAKNLYQQAKTNRAPVINSSLKQYLKSNPRSRFDYITIMHVIEHVSDPRQFLADCLKQLSKGGILYIETPNIESYLFRAEQTEYTFLTPPDHTVLFSTKSLLLLLKKTGVTVKSKIFFSFPEHVVPILKSWLKKKSSKNQVGVAKSIGKERLKKKNVIKYRLINGSLAPLLVPLLNFGGKGSIMGFYISKK